MQWHRIWGLMLRYFYSFNHTIDRWVDAFYWPTLDLIIWGLTISFLRVLGNVSHMQITTIISGLILWYVLWRGQYEITLNILEEFWEENLSNFLATPIKLSEWICSLFLLSIIKLILTFGFITVLAILLYSVNIFDLSFALIPFIVSLLISGWICGLFVGGIFLRFGTRLQSLAWAGAYLLMPFSATFYPLSFLPSWAKGIATILPSSYIFEGMRQTLSSHEIPYALLEKSFLLNGIYLLLALIFFYRSFQKAKEKGIAHLK